MLKIFVAGESEKMHEEYRIGAITMDDRTDYTGTSSRILTVPETNTATTLRYGAYTYPSVNVTAYGYDEKINELKDMISQLKAKPYFMKIQCHNCGAPLTIDSSNHLVKCRYCHTAYFSGTQLVNSNI